MQVVAVSGVGIVQQGAARRGGSVNEGRRGELLDGLMGIIAERGFVKVGVAAIAGELRCSLASLYAIAPSKELLVAEAITRWGESSLAHADTRAQTGETASQRARNYLRSGAEAAMPHSHAFRRDIQRVEPARQAYQEISDRFVARLSMLIDEAVQAGDVRPVNVTFVAGMLLHVAAAVRDEDLLDAAGLTASGAIYLIESIIWDGLQAEDEL